MRTFTHLLGYVFCVLATVIIFSCPGCQAIKKKPAEPARGEVIQEAYPISVYGYKTSVLVKESPDKIISHVLRDLSWIENVSSLLKFEITDFKPDTDLTQPGHSFGFNLKILGINFPCRDITFRYKSKEEVWIMVLTGGHWALFRYKATAVPEGTLVDVNIVGKPSKRVGEIMSAFKLVEATAHWIDLLIACIQAEFDPELDPREVTKKGLRGEIYETMFQAHEARVWVDATPEEVFNFHRETQNSEEVSGLKYLKKRVTRDNVTYAPTSVGFVNINMVVDNFFIDRSKEENMFITYLTWRDYMGFLKFYAEPKNGGTEMRMIIAMEIPESSSAKMIDFVIAMTGTSRKLKQTILESKMKLEAADK